MKKIILLTAVVFALVCPSLAQSNKEEVDLVQSVFGMEKKALVDQFIKPTEGPAKDAFWTLYDEYELKRKELGKKRLALLYEYTSNYLNLDDVSGDKMINDMISLQTQTDKLIATYYKKIKKGSGVKVAAQFYQFENYILSKIRGAIMEGIPLIGEFDNH
jgi:hypothetical protein